MTAGEVRYHVPRSQVWEGSRGRQTGHNHLHVLEQFDCGRLHRHPGRSLCGKRGWYETTDPHDAPRCSGCAAASERHGIQWPSPEPATVGRRGVR